MSRRARIPGGVPPAGRRSGRRPPVWFAAVLLLSLGACAQVKQENRRTLNALDAAATPESEAGRWALSPVALPAGILALVVDMVVVHPACSLDDAWGDTVQLLWTPRGESRFRRAVLLPLVTLATPLVFAGDWLGRALLPIPPRDDDDDAP